LRRPGAQSSYATFLASISPSDLGLSVQSKNLTAKLARLPGVERVEAALLSLNAFPLSKTGAPIIPPAFRYSQAIPVGSIDGEYFDQDRVTVTAGQLANPDRADEFVATAPAARLLGWHVGQVIPMGFYTNSQSPTSRPLRQLRMTLTGIVTFDNEAVLDDVDKYPSFVLFTPALTGPFSTGPENVYYGLKLTDGALGVPAVEHEIIRAVPGAVNASFHLTSAVENQVNQTVEPEAIALAVFGGIAALATVLIASQVIGRQIQQAGAETAVLRALGASRLVIMGDALGTGALIPSSIAPPAMQQALSYQNATLNGPAAALVQLKNGVPPAVGLAPLQRIASAGTRAFEQLPSSLYQGQSVNVLPVQYPAEIENYQSIGATPALLAAGLAAGAVIALGLTLMASVRRGRRDLALLKTLGFTRRQLACCLAW
jgi:hypothetical protein